MIWITYIIHLISRHTYTPLLGRAVKTTEINEEKTFFYRFFPIVEDIRLFSFNKFHHLNLQL